MSKPPHHELFPDEDDRFRGGVRRGDIDAFFRPTPAGPTIRTEWRQWPESDPERYAAITEDGRPLLAAFHGVASRWVHAKLPCVRDCSN